MTATQLVQLLGSNFSDAKTAAALSALRGLRADVEQEPGPEGVRYLRSPREGVLIKLSADGEILAVFLMSEGKEGFAQFADELPGDLGFDATPEEAIAALGVPAMEQPPATYGGLRTGSLLRFDLPTYSLHLQFRAEGGIDLVTAMVARAVPGRSVAARRD